MVNSYQYIIELLECDTCDMACIKDISSINILNMVSDLRHCPLLPIIGRFVVLNWAGKGGGGGRGLAEMEKMAEVEVTEGDICHLIYQRYEMTNI